jgi:hypothetical protein
MTEEEEELYCQDVVNSFKPKHKGAKLVKTHVFYTKAEQETLKWAEEFMKNYERKRSNKATD